MIVYDETESYKAWDDPQFMYPFKERKTKIGSFKFKVYEPDWDDYLVDTAHLQFYRGFICLERPFYDQLNFYNKLFGKLDPTIKDDEAA